MICPKCKKQIPDRSLKCVECGAKIATFCKKCNSYNSIYNLKCTKCGNELLKICPSCKSVNFPNAAKCRKCGFNFLEKSIENKVEISNANTQVENVKAKQKIKIKPPKRKEKVETLDQSLNKNLEQTIDRNLEQNLGQQDKKPTIEEYPSSNIPEENQNGTQNELQKSDDEDINLNYNNKTCSQQTAKDIIVKSILADSKLIALNGQTGVGKTIVLKAAMQDLRKDSITWMFGECSNLTQLSPCGLIQDILLTLFNIPNFSLNDLKLKKDSQKFFHTEFPTLTNDEIFNLLNFLYPSNADYYENILLNKQKTFKMLKKVFSTIIQNTETIIVVENFEYIDGMSYEFLHNLINSELITNQLKFIITYNEIRPGKSYLYNNKLEDSAYVDISLGAFDRAQVISLGSAIVNSYFPEDPCPKSLKAELYNVTTGNPAALEQYANLIADFKAKNNTYQITLPSTITEAISMRLDFLKDNPLAYQVIAYASIQGIKFSHALVNQILQIDENKYNEILNLLQQLNYIVPVNQHLFAFKNSTLWNNIFEYIKQSSDFVVISNNMLSLYNNYNLSNHTILAIIAQNLNDNSSALKFWTDNIKIAAYIGDTNLYVISQKQCLNLLKKITKLDNSELIKNNIFERLGKLLSKNHPKEATEYLPNAIINSQRNMDALKEIELTGYLASCCQKLNNYYGVIECVDTILEKIDISMELEIAMVKSRKLNALLAIGNCGELVSLIDNEILPVLDKYLNAKPHKNISINSLYKTWLETYLVLANTLALQGNNRSIEVINSLFDILKQNELDNDLFICKTKLAQAFANTMCGEVETSENMLSEILKEYKTDIMDNESISKWNLINILNNFSQKNYTELKDELYQVVTFANNINDEITKNTLRMLLGKIFKDEENAKGALEIYSEQITFFSKEKLATGALLGWYLIAEAKLVTEGPESAIDVAQKALEVAQSVKINNYTFIVLLNKIIAEAFIIQSDYESAKIYIETAIMVAQKFEILGLLAQLYLLYGKYLQDIAIVKSETQLDYISGASKMFKKASLISRKIRNKYLIASADKAKTVLNSYCQLNNIILHDKQ